MKTGPVAAILFVMATLCAAQEAPRVRETQSRRRVTGDPAMKPSAAASRRTLPARALADGPHAVIESEKTRWAAAKWSDSTLQLPGTAQRTIAVPGPATVLVRATWTGPPVTVTISRQGTILATAKSTRRHDGSTVATAQTRAPSAGEVVVRAAGPGSVRVDLYVGILSSAH